MCPVKFRAISSVAFNFPFRRRAYVNIFPYFAVFLSCLSFPICGVVFHGTTFLIESVSTKVILNVHIPFIAW